MKILVTGSRHFEDYNLLKAELDALCNISKLIHGAARGADTLAERYGRENNIPIHRYPADWSLGRRAGPIRNGRMIIEGKPDLVIAFLAPNSRGTKNMIEQAKKANVPVRIINI